MPRGLGAGIRTPNKKQDPSGGCCLLQCKRYKATQDILEIAHVEVSALEDEVKTLAIYRDCMDSLVQLSSAGYQILGVESHDRGSCAVVMAPVDIGDQGNARTVCLYRLPFHHRLDWTCRLHLSLCSNCRAHIIDWSSNIPNKGYGSILMKYLIPYLRAAGFKTLTGTICPTDFNHEGMLRHFYGKFGFQIKDQSDRRELRLDLFEKAVSQQRKDGFLVCCRTAEHEMLQDAFNETKT